MKTTIYELLGMIKDGKAPKEIIYKQKGYSYENNVNDYYCSSFGEYLFDEYVLVDILNDEVEILETTITLKDSFNYLQKLAEDEIPNKIEKLSQEDIETYMSYGEQLCANKINEIIDILNKEN